VCFLEEKQSDVAFGSSGDRQIFPSSVPHTRFGTELNTITGSPNLGPGHYKVEQVIIVFVQFITAVCMLTVYISFMSRISYVTVLNLLSVSGHVT